jgi:oligoribonuclease NrnB/cAMP/cGMP phosphodiesterase (DHH superfamily)
MQRRIFSIIHGKDVDGLFCGAILKNAFQDTLVFLTNYGYGNVERAADIINFNVSRSSKSGIIVFSDLTVNSDEDVEPTEEAAIRLKSRGRTLVWLDHHTWLFCVECTIDRYKH